VGSNPTELTNGRAVFRTHDLEQDFAVGLCPERNP
jgi:hypothetical protein